MMNRADLEAYRDRVLALPLSELKILEVRVYPVLVASVVHREGRFQTELVQALPNNRVPAHRHPHINALEVHISGDLRIVIGATPEEAESSLEKARIIPERFARRKSFQIPGEAWHAAKTGPKGASFFSFQEWTGEVPLTAAGVDWEGAGM